MSTEEVSIAPETHLQIGSLLFEQLDQLDLTGPFEVLSRIPNTTYRIYGLNDQPVRDIRGLRLMPDASIDSAPQLDVVHVPGGYGQEELMDDEHLLAWLRRQGDGARCVFSVCTGALLLGAAGMLNGKRATTHWSAHSLLPFFGAQPVDARVVTDGALVSAAGVTAGIDGALTVAARLRGIQAAQQIQLHMAYAPEPPFDSGSPDTAPAQVLSSAQVAVAAITERRRNTAVRVAQRLGIAPNDITTR